MPDTGLGHLLDEFKRLRERCDELEERVRQLEGVEAAPGLFDHDQKTHLIDTEKPPEIDPEEAFGPKTQRRPGTAHANAVGKALKMLGLFPDQEDEEQQRQLSAKHKETLGKALHVLGIAPKERPGEAEAEPGERVVLTPPPPREEQPEGDFVPLPDLAAEPSEAADEESVVFVHEPVDLGTAVPVDLERARADSAVPILNAAILLAAVGAALSAAGLVSLPGEGKEISWPEITAAGAATLLGGLALTWRSASIHVRGVLGGVAVLGLNALALLVLRGRVASLPLPVVGAALAVAASVATRVVLSTKHPLALLLGLSGSLLLPLWIAVPPALAMPYALALNVAVAVGALRLRRLQAGIAAAIFTFGLFSAVAAPEAPVYAALCAAALLVPALWAPFLFRHAGKAAAVLALTAFGFTAWVVHALYAGPWLVKVGGLFLPATLAALVAGRLPRHEEFLRGSLKAGAVLLILSALPVGFSGQTLVAVGLFISLLFGVFAYSLYDAYLRAAGALLLVLSVSMLARAGGSAPFVIAASVVATVLYAVRARGTNPPALALLLGGVAHGSILWAAALLLPAPFVAHAWAVLSVGYVVAGQGRHIRFLKVGAAAAAGAAALGALVLGPPDAVRIAVTGLLLAPHFWLTQPARSAGLMLLLTELLLVTAAQIAFAGPLGVLVALAAPAILALPVWNGATATLRSHARFLTLVILVRCLFPDLIHGHAEPAWMNLRFAALVAATVPAFCIVWLGTAGRTAAASLATAVLGAAVWAETLSWAAVGVAVALVATACALLLRRPGA